MRLDHPGRAPSQWLAWLLAVLLVLTLGWVLVHGVALVWLLSSR